MKKIAFLSVMYVVMIVSAKSQNPARSILPQGSPALPMFMEDIAGRPYNKTTVDGIDGSPFLVEDWSWGAVKFKDGHFAKDIPLRFNVYNNKLYFQREEEQLEFVKPVQEFMLGFVKEGDSIAMIFRNGYPASSKTNSETYFELLADGKFQLVKNHTKNIQSFKPYNQPERKKFEDASDLYVYTANGKFVKIKKDRDAIIEALPEYADQIKAVIEQNKLKIKSEASVAGLFDLLNRH